jgi:tight adherence protein B
MGIVYLSSPDYISLLWSNQLGQVMLMACAIWMLIGIVIMRKMIRFDY